VRIADVIYNQVALKKNRLLYGGIMKKSCDNCKFEEYSWKEQVCVSCERHGMVQYKDNWQPKPTDKDQTKAEDNKVKLKRRETCMYCGQKITAGQEDRDNICDFEKCPTVNNYRINLKQIQHLQSKLDKAVELIKGYYPDTDYAEGVDHEDFIKVKKRLNKQAEQFLKDCKGE